jgi:hypothetical protein
MVEAAEVEPAQHVENNKVVDFRIGRTGKKGQKGKSTVQTLYKMLLLDRLSTRSAPRSSPPKYPP